MTTVETANPTLSERQYEAHDSSADFLGKLASSEFGVNFSEHTISNWTKALRVILRVDNIFDGSDQAAKEQATSSLRTLFSTHPENYTNGLDEETLSQITTLRGQINDEQAASFMTKGLQVISIGQSMRTVESARELSRLTMLEGQMTTTMLVHLIDSADKNQSNLNDFIRFLRVGSRVANVLDSIADLKTDYNEGISAVKPTFSNRILMGWEALPHIKKSISSLGALAIAKRMPHAALSILRDRARKPENL